MRSRLDREHETTDFPVLSSAGYDPDSVRAKLTLEEDLVLEDMDVDVYANGS